jgi:hypothetical protein
MSNLPSEQPNLSPLDEQLVSYLDGELEPQAAKQVEELLASDETARNRLSQLAASWDLLDQLPRATVDDMFTRTTVQMVAVAAEDELAQVNAAQPAVRRRRWLEGALATLAAAVIGFVIVSVGVPSENDALVRNLTVVHDLELYQEAGNLEYLNQLQRSHLVGDESAEASPGAAAVSSTDAHTAGSAATVLRPIPKSTDERRAWIDALTPSEKLDLRENFEKFANLPAAQQQALRHFDEQLYADPNAAQLHRVMQRYYEWLRTLSAVDRTDLKNKSDAEQRFALAKQLKTQQEQRVFTNLSRGQVVPRDPDNIVVIHWLREFVESHKTELNALIEEIRPEGTKSSDPRRSRPLIMQAYNLWWAPLTTKSAPVSDAEMKALVAQLSPERQQQFAAAADRAAQLSLLDKWIQRAVEAQFIAQGGFRAGRRVNLEGLAAFEEHDLTDKQRQELQDLPEGQRRRKLIEWFMQSAPRAGGQRFPGGFPRGGPPDGPRPEGPPPRNQPPREPPGPSNDRA